MATTSISSMSSMPKESGADEKDSDNRWCRVYWLGAGALYHQRNERRGGVVVDKLTYAGNLMSLAPVAQSERFAFEKVDICDRAELARVFTEYQPDCVMHLASARLCHASGSRKPGEKPC